MVRWAGAWLGLQQAVPISWSLARAVSSSFPFIVIALTDRFFVFIFGVCYPKGSGSLGFAFLHSWVLSLSSGSVP